MPDKTKYTDVGLDIAKAQLDYTVENKIVRVPNQTEGIGRLLEYLQTLPNPRVIVEASGGYEGAVVAVLQEAGVTVCVVQPARVRAYARAAGIWAKTDRVDAWLLRRYAQAMDLRATMPAEPAAAQLRELSDRADDLVQKLAVVKNQFEHVRPSIRVSLEREKEFLEKEIVVLKKQIAEHLAAQPVLQDKAKRLQQMQGVGPVVARTLLSHLPELGHVSDRTIAALVGVAPYPDDSGTRHGPRHIRGGRIAVRRACYMAALAATRSNRVLREMYLRLKAKGKPHKVCLIAVMHKMLRVLNSMLTYPDFVLDT